MRRVVAQGTFDLLHPGHVHYLEEAESMGEELHVIIARSDNVTHKKEPVIPDGQRRDMVAALDPVDEVHLGHTRDFFVPIRDIDPDVIVLGYDQHHNEGALAEMLEDEGIDCEVTRATAREPRDGEEVLSTTDIVERICETRC